MKKAGFFPPQQALERKECHKTRLLIKFLIPIMPVYSQILAHAWHIVGIQFAEFIFSQG